MKNQQKTKLVKPSEIKRDWYLVDASQEILGRIASKIARILQGKHRPYYTPHWDMGDHVVVINSGKIKVTGNKEKGKIYYWHTGYPGGLKQEPLAKRRARKPNEIILHAVRRMLPKNNLARTMIKKLHIYEGSEYPHTAQKPILLVDREKVN